MERSGYPDGQSPSYISIVKDFVYRLLSYHVDGVSVTDRWLRLSLTVAYISSQFVVLKQQ